MSTSTSMEPPCKELMQGRFRDRYEFPDEGKRPAGWKEGKETTI